MPFQSDCYSSMSGVRDVRHILSGIPQSSARTGLLDAGVVSDGRGMESTSEQDKRSSEDDQLSEDNWDGWEASDGEMAAEVTKSLFEDSSFASAAEALEHDKTKFGFDLLDFIADLKLDEYEIIKLINYVRTEVSEGRSPLPTLENKPSPSAVPWMDDKFLQPVVQEDPLLFFDYQDAIGKSGKNPEVEGSDFAPASDELDMLREQNTALVQQLEMLKLDPEVQKAVAELRQVEGRAAGAPRGSGSDLIDPTTMARRIDRNYFDSYSSYEIHKDMLGDKVRTESYRNALEKNPRLMQGKVVLDVGCGTGILSLFAARGGAARVVAVDGSDWAAKMATKIAGINGYLEGQGDKGVVQVISGKLEDLGSRLKEQVDVIVSEWMGYALLFESMLETVLHARDMFLKPGGAILPDIVSMFIAGTSEAGTGLDFWKDVYGFNMLPIREVAYRRAVRTAIVQNVKKQHIITETSAVRKFDLINMSPREMHFTTDFELVPLQPDVPTSCHALCMWFDAIFSERFCKEHPVTLSTSPFSTLTHWNQTVLALKQPIELGGKNGAARIKGRLSMAKGSSHRSLDISVEYWEVWKDGREGDSNVVLYMMSIGI